MRLIDADALLLKAENSFRDAGLHSVDYGKIRKWIVKAPTIDVEPQVQISEVTYTDRQHGEWVRSGDADEPTTFFTKWKCSVCGYSNGRRFNSNYCPNCGAQMIKGYAKGDMK